MTTKASILEVIERLPGDAGFDEAIEEIRILRAIEEGERAADEGRVRPHHEVEGMLRSWISK